MKMLGIHREPVALEKSSEGGDLLGREHQRAVMQFFLLAARGLNPPTGRGIDFDASAEVFDLQNESTVRRDDQIIDFIFAASIAARHADIMPGQSLR